MLVWGCSLGDPRKRRGPRPSDTLKPTRAKDGRVRPSLEVGAAAERSDHERNLGFRPGESGECPRAYQKVLITDTTLNQLGKRKYLSNEWLLMTHKRRRNPVNAMSGSHDHLVLMRGNSCTTVDRFDFPPGIVWWQSLNFPLHSPRQREEECVGGCLGRGIGCCHKRPRLSQIHAFAPRLLVGQHDVYLQAGGRFRCRSVREDL